MLIIRDFSYPLVNASLSPVLGRHLTVEGIEECLKGCGEKDDIDVSALEKAATDVGVSSLHYN